ncbi:MAG TPA: DUF1996 domain-containing protein [Acidimicrobiales bacterium]|nr:DUF1996 domain-containing protein [Acidimicrobiales bacterium]
MRLGAGAILLALLLVACGGASAPSPPSPPAAVRLSPTDPGPQGRVPQFVVECGFSHAAPDDPIVHPGHAGLSHLHTFFGSTLTGAGSTAEGLATGSTTCDQQLDRAAYWAPALLDGGAPVTPTGAIAYYRPGVDVDPASVEPYPFGLAMLAGEPHAEEGQPLDVVAWSCGTGSERHTAPPECPRGRPLRLAVAFPDCWDGRNLDSPDHRAHVARSERGRCPESHPVAVPQLLLTVSYPVAGPGHDLALASGPLTGGHADFLNAWDPDKLRTEVESCLQRGLTCGVASTRS